MLFACPEDAMIERVLSRNIPGEEPERADDRNMSVLRHITSFRSAISPILERYRRVVQMADTGGTLGE